jgi:hypothetical protein
MRISSSVSILLVLALTCPLAARSQVIPVRPPVLPPPIPVVPIPAIPQPVNPVPLPTVPTLPTTGPLPTVPTPAAPQQATQQAAGHATAAVAAAKSAVHGVIARAGMTFSGGGGDSLETLMHHVHAHAETDTTGLANAIRLAELMVTEARSRGTTLITPPVIGASLNRICPLFPFC